MKKMLSKKKPSKKKSELTFALLQEIHRKLFPNSRSMTAEEHQKAVDALWKDK